MAHPLDDLTFAEVKQLYMRFWNTADGRIVLEDLKRRGYFYDTTFPDNGNSERTLVNEGCRQMILTIETMLEPEPKPEKAEKED